MSDESDEVANDGMPLMIELRLEFHRALEEIEGRVIRMFALVAEDLAVVTDAILSGDDSMIGVLSEREQAIDLLNRETEALVNRHFACQSPVAGDLRLLLSVLQTVPELERSHDLIVDIANLAQCIDSGELSPRARGLIQRMGDTSAAMWRRAAEGWHSRDSSTFAVLDETDIEMDGFHSSLSAEVAKGQMGVPAAIPMTLIARFYARLGDHAVNVSRRIGYLVEGSPPTKLRQPKPSQPNLSQPNLSQY
jgi:phosphate transport system protein